MHEYCIHSCTCYLYMQLHEENQNSGFKNIPMNFPTIVDTFNDSFYDTCTREPKYIYIYICCFDRMCEIPSCIAHSILWFMTVFQ